MSDGGDEEVGQGASRRRLVGRTEVDVPRDVMCNGGYQTWTVKCRVSIAYALIRDINDQAWRADWLADHLRCRRMSTSSR